MFGILVLNIEHRNTLNREKSFNYIKHSVEGPNVLIIYFLSRFDKRICSYFRFTTHTSLV